MKTLRRFPAVTILDSATLEAQPELSPEGFLRCAVNATRAGVFIYRDENGAPVRALRPESEVFKPESMASLPGKPITREHPKQLLDSKTAKPAVVGSTGDQATRVDNFLRVMANIFDGETIAAIATGRKEVSCGYIADVVDAPGIDPVHGAYDVVQENIRYNHLAVAIAEGRGGPEVRMLMDSAELSSSQEKAMPEPSKEMKTIKLGDVEHEITPALHDALTAHIEGLKAEHKKAMDELAGQVSGLKKLDEDEDGDIENLTEETEGQEEDAACAKMDSIEPKSERMKKVKTRISRLLGKVAGLTREVKAKMDAASPERLAEAAKTQATMVATVCALDSKAKPADLFGKSVGELKRLAILARDPKAVLDGKDAAYIDGRFDAIASSVKPSNIGEVLGAMLLDTKSEPTQEQAAPAQKKWTPVPLSASTRPAAKQ